MKDKRKPLILLAIAVIAVSIYTYSRTQGRSHPAPNLIRVSGNVEATEVELGFEIPGRVQARLVSEGQTIRAGQITAQLDSTPLAQEVGLRTAEVQAAQADLAELQAGSRPEEIRQAQAGLRLAQAEADRWQAEYTRQKGLYEKDVISKREYENAATSYEASQARVQQAREQLALAEKGPRPEKIDQARARLEKARQALAAAQTRLSYATLVSPLSGLVLSDHVEPGEYVGPGTPVVTIGDLEQVWLRAYIDETDLGRVQPGQQVRVTADTYPGKSYPGRVSFIASEAEFTPKNIQTQKERVKLVYRIKVDIPNPARELKPGMPADAEILVASEVQ